MERENLTGDAKGVPARSIGRMLSPNEAAGLLDKLERGPGQEAPSGPIWTTRRA
jgi:hypothetical protein